jgi:hypothetical protein
MINFIHTHWIIMLVWFVIGLFMAGFETQKSELLDKDKKAKGETVKEYTAGVRLLAFLTIVCMGPIGLIANFGAWCCRRYNEIP